MSHSQSVLLGTRNPHKVQEIEAMCSELGLKVRPLPKDFPEVDEDRPSMRGNAAKKALEYAQQAGALCLADDTGLCVEALGGAPGVLSARYAGPDCEPADNNAKLLRELGGRPKDERRAHFLCVMAIADPEGLRLVVEGRLDGYIATELKGEGGFGYDPLFLLDDGRSLAELSIEDKNRISHRGCALRRLRSGLAAIL